MWQDCSWIVLDFGLFISVPAWYNYHANRCFLHRQPLVNYTVFHRLDSSWILVGIFIFTGECVCILLIFCVIC